MSDFQYKENRYMTFTNNGWKSTYHARPEDLAAAGFVYEGNGDEVRCVCCQLKLENWEPKDDIRDEHKNMSANCRFVINPENCEGDETVVSDYTIDTVNDVVMFNPASYSGMKIFKKILILDLFND